MGRGHPRDDGRVITPVDTRPSNRSAIRGSIDSKLTVPSATIGKPRRLSKAVRQLIISPRREHSRKPDEAYGRIEGLVSGPYLELFAWCSRPGWKSWGNQVSLFDEEPMPTRNRRLGSARRSSSICDLFEGV